MCTRDARTTKGRRGCCAAPVPRAQVGQGACHLALAGWDQRGLDYVVSNEAEFARSHFHTGT
jgi:hypothetical protein